MSDSKRPDNDPSMDDILASIRKIISADEARAQVGSAPAAPAPRARPDNSTAPPISTAAKLLRYTAMARKSASLIWLVLLTITSFIGPKDPARSPCPVLR